MKFADNAMYVREEAEVEVRLDVSGEASTESSGHDTFESGLRRFVMEDLLLAV